MKRRLLLGAGVLTPWLAGCALLPEPRPGRPLEIGPGVYMVPGTGGVADEHNQGRIGNSGFIVGDSGVVAIDTGTSHAHGMALLQRIREVTDQPVKLALVTHTRPEFLFGGTAFRSQGIPIRMHARTAGLMASRCEGCLKRLRETLGEAAMQGTAVYKPDQVVDATEWLQLIGRPVQVLHFGHSSGPGDVAVFEPRSGVLFAGGLIDVGRVPDIEDSDLDGWRRALRAMHGLRVATVVPGHGPSASWASAAGGVERYLDRLEARVKAHLRAGGSLLDVAEQCDLPEFESWDQYNTIHRRNASIAFLRFERQQMFNQPTGAHDHATPPAQPA
ncbi:MAG: MBL fold metallo-hydrolase [Vitreoscilla sp.]|nr:MBL fold metallo-hydrolase [Vitreoscilla sp.]